LASPSQSADHRSGRRGGLACYRPRGLSSPPEETRFGKYRLLDRIAIGGMAEIFRARYQAAAGVTKPVVIKKILPAFAGNPNFVSMFINEARIVVGLAHGNIAQVFDFGEIDGEYYLAMEDVPGYPLSKVMRQARTLGLPVLPAPFACFIALELCRGLHYAHTRRDEKNQLLGLVHRDVSPQNILLSYEGQVKIVDFGIAKARNASSAETQPGAVKGKYFYFAPEQCRGEPLDARADVYAVGVVLYEMLTGRLPFEGGMVGVFRRIVAGDFDRPRSVNANLPASLEAIVLKAMSADRTRRYQSAQELGDDLANFLFAQAPTFSSAALAQLMGFLYEEQLQADGFPSPVAAAFRQEVEAWRGGKFSLGDETQGLQPLAAPRKRVPSSPAQQALPVKLRVTPARGIALPQGEDDEATLPPDDPSQLAPRTASPGEEPATELAPRLGASIGRRPSSPSSPRAQPVGRESSTELSPRRMPEANSELSPRAAPPVPDLASSPVPGVAAPRTLPLEPDALHAADELVARRLLGEGDFQPAPPRVTPVFPRQASTPVATAVAAPRPPPKWLFVALPLVAMLLAAVGVILLGARTASIQLSSEPPGALVLLDGVPAPTRTPMLISDLDPDSPHLLEVQAPGMHPWQQRLTLRRGELLAVHARLVPLGSSRPPPPPGPGLSAPPAATPP